MARLQILELPEGTGDDRPPFALVIDEISEDESAQIIEAADALDGFAKKAGARATAVFHGMTIEIPANGSPPGVEETEVSEADFTEMATAVRRALGINMTEAGVEPDIAGWLLAACRELEKSEAARRHLNGERDRLKAAVDRARQTPTEPEVMNSEQAHPNVWLHGYRCGVLAARSAAVPRDEKASGS